MENSKRRSTFQFSRVSNWKWFGHYNKNRSGYKYDNNNHSRNYLWSVILVILCPARALANTTVASPSSQAQGTVNNNATQIMPNSSPQFRMSQGIVCSSPSLTITPYVTDAHTYNLPRESVTRQNIYNEDTGAIKYVQETPRFEKDNFNINYGISAQLNIPLGKAPYLCHKATEINIKNQELLYKKTSLELALFRLKVCSEQAKLGATFTGKYASICEGIQVTVPPNQVIPHTHEIKSND